MNKDTVEVKIELEQEKVFEEIPITINGQGDKNITFIQPDSATIDVVGTGSDQIVKDLQDKDINATIDVSNLEEGEHRLEIDVTGPKRIRLIPDLTRVTIEIE